MLIVDANVLLNAVNQRAREHGVAQRWLGASLAGAETVGFAWTVVLAFLRVATHATILPRPLGRQEATDVVEPTARHLALLAGLLERAGTAGNLVNDAHLAALALEHGATVVSFDRDLGRFEGVRTLVPA